MIKGFENNQLKLVFEFAEWLEEFATTKWEGNTMKLPKGTLIWSVPRKTKHGEWYSNWTTEVLWVEFLKQKGEVLQ